MPTFSKGKQRGEAMICDSCVHDDYEFETGCHFCTCPDVEDDTDDDCPFFYDWADAKADARYSWKDRY